MKKFWTAFVHGTEGQDLIEYALLAATIALGVVGGMTALKTGINNEFSTISSSLAS
ncbi:MAG: Flp family type IVb pilin [Acidobacteriota bacterium]